MTRKLLTALVLAAWTVALSATPTHKQTLLSYIGEDPATGGQWMRPMVAPLVEVKVLEGHKPTLDRRTIMCSWSIRATEHKLADGTLLSSNVGVFLCEDGTVLELTNVSFGEAQ